MSNEERIKYAYIKRKIDFIKEDLQDIYNSLVKFRELKNEDREILIAIIRDMESNYFKFKKEYDQKIL